MAIGFKRKTLIMLSKFLILVLLGCSVCVNATRINLENGIYNGILIGIDIDASKISRDRCPEILERLNKTLLPLLSQKLYQVTGASLGQVDVLLPQGWSNGVCNLNASSVVTASANYSYQDSDIQITLDHPFLANNSLPWTKQYRPCGNSADSILLPLPFVLSDPNTIQDSVKAQLLLHEWLKFRYGVFDELAYDDSEEETGVKASFPPCYIYDKQAHFSVCSDSQTLFAVAQNTSTCTQDFFKRNEIKLRESLSNGSTSIMASPYIDSVTHFCNESTHNPWSLTKQNYFCNRRSIAEVVSSHPDFKNLPVPPPELPIPQFRVLQHSEAYEPGYAFIIENSPEMREAYKLQHIKQAIAQFLQVLNKTVVCLFIEDGFTVNPIGPITLNNENDQVNFLERIADTLTGKMSNSEESSRLMRLPLLEIVKVVSSSLSTRQQQSWNVFLFSNALGSGASENDTKSAIDFFQSTPHTISIFHFDHDSISAPSNLWTLWYKIPNTKNVVSLPYCTNSGPQGGPCSFLTSAFILDHFMGTCNQHQYKARFLENPVGSITLLNRAGEKAQFQMPDLHQAKEVHVFLSIHHGDSDFKPAEYFRLLSPKGQTCEPEILLNYNMVMTFPMSMSCPFRIENGYWTLEMIQQISSSPSTLPFLLNLWVEMNDPSLKFIVTPSLGASSLIDGLSPNNSNIPVFVSLQTPKGNPVLDAEVLVRVYPSSILTNSNKNGTGIFLRDNGDVVDQTKNDGVYSAYLNGFSNSSASYHLVQVQITTTASTKILETIQPSKAFLLHKNLTAKCCGARIEPLETTTFPSPIRFQALHLGFRTTESWATPRYPPTPVKGDIEPQDDTDSSLTINFVAAYGDSSGNAEVIVVSYQACCAARALVSEPVLPDENSCKANTVECESFESPNSQQTCVLNKNNLAKLFVPSSDLTYLTCAIRAVNSDGEFGSISQSMFEVDVAVAVEARLKEEQSCEKFSLSDKCLPIWIFWVMIGCLGLLLLVFIILACCWCYCARKNKKKTPKSTNRENVLAVHYTPPPEPSSSNRTRTPDSILKRTDTSGNNDNNNQDNNDSKVVKELFVNHAYIQDGDGEIKIIADNGQILRKPKMENNDYRHSPLPPSILATRHQPASPSPQVEENIQMQVFKPVPMQKPQRPSRPSKDGKSRGGGRNPGGDRPQIVHPNPMLRSDTSTYNEMPPRIPHQQRELSPEPIHSANPGLVYATISRNGRLKPISPTGKPISFDPHYQVPHNSVANTRPLPPQGPSQLSKISREPPAQRSLPPLMPEYPPTMTDSDSSIYDPRAERLRRVPPRFAKPPPYPAGSQMVKQVQHPQPQRQQSPNHYGGGRGGVPVQLPAMGNPPPPVPPPRYDRTSSVKSPNAGAVQNFSTRQEVMSTDDDDSDQWDDGDNTYEFGNASGVSYA